MEAAMHRLRWTYVFLLLSTAVFAQTFRGTLSGTVTDVQGAVIADVKVVLTNPATGTVLTSSVNGTGEFSFPELPVGKYSLSVSSPGFASKKIDNIDIAVSKATNLRVELNIG